MSVSSVIRKSQLEGNSRLDPEYYQPKYLAIKRKLSISPRLAELSKRITDFGAYSQMNFVQYTNNGIRFLRNQDIKELFIDDSGSVFISNETYNKLTLKLDNYDIITPRVGTLGNAAIVLKEHIPASANQNLAQIKPNISKIDPFYLTIFLCSYYGRKQFERYATGNVQPWLNLLQIKSLKVFVPDDEEQRKIRKLAIDSFEENKKSNLLYAQAENLLLEELGLADLKPRGELYYTVNLKDTRQVHRLDAEYFQPKYAYLLQKLQRFKVTILGEIASLKKGIEVGSEAYQEQGIPFIRVSDLSKQGVNRDDPKLISDELYQELKINYQPKKGEILLTKDATPGIAYVLEDEIKGIIAGGVVRLKIKYDIDRQYLALVISSVVGQEQITRDGGGSVITHWKPEQIKSLLIPVLDKSIQQKLSGLVRRSHEARRRAGELLAQAKHQVEQLIEKSA